MSETRKNAADRNGTSSITACGMRGLRSFMIAATLVGAMALPAHAESNDGREGFVMIYTRTGGVLQKQINDEAMLNELLKDSTVIPEGGVVMMHGGKWYLVQNHKMADGNMVVDSISRK